LLKKRYDLIPNLVATVKGYMQHERTLLSEVTEMRAKALSEGTSDDQKVDLDNKMTKALGRIMVAVENYPDLKASDNFMHLQRTLTELEEQISAARRAYNAAITDYNNAVEMFPTSIVASMMNYKRRRFFEISDKERQSVDVAKAINT
ncbi:MAG: LemA family protein, partial [Planctomycetota bacterium]